MFDTACYELAASFIEDSNIATRLDVEHRKCELAQEIQDVIERFIAAEEEPKE